MLYSNSLIDLDISSSLAFSLRSSLSGDWAPCLDGGSLRIVLAFRRRMLSTVPVGVVVAVAISLCLGIGAIARYRQENETSSLPGRGSLPGGRVQWTLRDWINFLPLHKALFRFRAS